MPVTTQPLKWHGGKHYLAPKIVALMPRHMHYVEAYAGGAAVLLHRDPNDERLWWSPHEGVSEVLNDLHGELINFWRVLQHKQQFLEFERIVQAVPLARSEFNGASQEHDPSEPVLSAVNFFIRARQSRAGTFKGFTQLTRSRLRRGINGNASEWLGAVDGLAEVHSRLQPVVLEDDDALTVIKREDTFGTLFYLDPPYLHETRVSTKAFEYEMSPKQHWTLLDVVCQVKGKVMLSGYRSKLYDSKLTSWNRHEFELANHAAGGASKRRMMECIWCNF